MDRNTLIDSFVTDWGYRDAVLNEYFRLALEDLIAEICPQPSTTLPMSDPERKIRRIVLDEEE